MRFNVAGLMKEPIGAKREFDVAEEVGQIDEQLVAVEPIKGQAKMTRTKDGILVNATLHTAVRLSCSRCLTEFSAPLNVRFSEQYLPVIDINTGLPLPRSEDRSVFTIDANHVLDLSEGFRQYALLALPLAPLCSATCAGLCPNCGQNLNEGLCQCPPPTGDARWAALADLLRKR
jgi:uncharacterized protein